MLQALPNSKRTIAIHTQHYSMDSYKRLCEGVHLYCRPRCYLIEYPSLKRLKYLTGFLHKKSLQQGGNPFVISFFQFKGQFLFLVKRFNEPFNTAFITQLSFSKLII